jgi:hypothetical protein
MKILIIMYNYNERCVDYHLKKALEESQVRPKHVILITLKFYMTIIKSVLTDFLLGLCA